MDADDFYDEVASRANLDSAEEGKTVTHAVLRTFTDRVSSGDVQAIRSQVPDELASALQTDTDQTPDQGAADFGKEQYVRSVQDNLGEDFDDEAAPDYARAVHGALRDVVGDAKMDDVESQLPEEYDVLFEEVDVEPEPQDGGT